jgi:hypothetical protein
MLNFENAALSSRIGQLGQLGQSIGQGRLTMM